MTQTQIPHLCGGILFGLLLEARKPRRKARNKLSGGTDGLTAADVYSGLIEVVTGEKMDYAGKAFNKSVSSYKNCSSSKGVYVPFTDPTTQSAFDSQYKRKSPDLLKRMSGFIDTYLNESKCEWLVRAIIETMQQEQIDIDIAVSDTCLLKVCDLQTAESIVFLPFLLSVLHYTIMNCPDCESGRPTFEEWYFQSSPKAEWKFKSDIGSGIKPMNISFDSTLTDQATTESALSSTNIMASEPITSTDSNGVDTRSDREVIAEHMGKALQPLVDVVKAQKAQLPDAEQIAKHLLMVADEAEALEHEIAEKKRNNEKKHHSMEHDEELYYSFKTDCDHILQYCIEKDPAAEPISVFIHNHIDSLIRKWNFEIRKIQDSNKRKLIQDVIQTLSNYTYYLSDKYLKLVDYDRLIFRNSSIEEGDHLRNELQPKSYELRCKMCELYKRLWPAPDLDQSTSDGPKSNPKETADANAQSQKDTKESFVHQTIVNQYGDHPVHIDHVDNLKL